MTGAPGATILGASGTHVTPDEAAFFRQANPWGFILFARNIETPDQVRRLTASLRDTVGRDAPILVDQEGGRVQRLRAPHWREWMAPLDEAIATGDHAEQAFALRYRLIAHELHAIGIDANCAPCLDLARPETHPFLRNRCLGSDPATVARLGRAASDAMLAGGVLPILKHMPGHGRGAADSHHDLPGSDAPLSELLTTDFAPFIALSDLPLAMSAHMLYRSIDSQPGTTSSAITALIRHRIGFQGLLMTDDIGMNALSGTPATRAAAAIAAGCDVVLHCNGTLAEMHAVADIAGPLSAPAQSRAARALTFRRTPDPVDIGRLEADLRALHAGTANG